MAAGVPPWVEVVAHDGAVEAELLGEDAVPEEVARCELLRGGLPAECQHEADGTQETGGLAYGQRPYSGWHVSVPRLVVTGVHGLPEIRPDDDLPRLIAEALRMQGDALRDGDVLAVAQKIVSKSEGRIVHLDDVTPGDRAIAMAKEGGKDPRQLEVVLSETAKIVRWAHGVLISETRHGFVCANAGVDRSNAGAPDTVILLPLDPDASALRIRDGLRALTGATVAVVVTDTFGRAWREGHMNVAIGIAGLPALKRYMGQFDPEGYELRVTEIAVADEVAAAAELVMGKLDRCPAALVRGLVANEPSETARDYVRPAERDLFR